MNTISRPVCMRERCVAFVSTTDAGDARESRKTARKEHVGILPDAPVSHIGGRLPHTRGRLPLTSFLFLFLFLFSEQRLFVPLLPSVSREEDGVPRSDRVSRELTVPLRTRETATRRDATRRDATRSVTCPREMKWQADGR